MSHYNDQHYRRRDREDDSHYSKTNDKNAKWFKATKKLGTYNAVDTTDNNNNNSESMQQQQQQKTSNDNGNSSSSSSDLQTVLDDIANNSSSSSSSSPLQYFKENGDTELFEKLIEYYRNGTYQHDDNDDQLKRIIRNSFTAQSGTQPLADLQFKARALKFKERREAKMKLAVLAQQQQQQYQQLPLQNQYSFHPTTTPQPRQQQQQQPQQSIFSAPPPRIE